MPSVARKIARKVTYRKFTEEFVTQLAKQAYRRNPDFRIDSKKCALLVIDMQEDFVKPYWSPFWVPEATRQVPLIKRLVKHCRNKKIPVIFTSFSRTNLFLDRPKSGTLMPNRFHWAPETQGIRSDYFQDGKIYRELAPLEKELVIHKPSYGAFYDTPLETILRNLGKDTVIICGTLTNYCCGTTARQAYERGFKVVFGSDITSTDDPSLLEPELRTLRKGFAKVLSLKEMIDGL